ncbi:hypothetical protein Veis_4175 [Verminephrobacter eiseniae EF01-2]|uniref:Integrase DNA-binding domain-containing protein n=2 Tax=Verminephrobacter eiseniae TaxID=364317 RepID=A1WQH3_VEREI|nr:hypothetical protein Veis_4175 [Verminephrobacter eiseniae EF01-2]
MIFNGKFFHAVAPRPRQVQACWRVLEGSLAGSSHRIHFPTAIRNPDPPNTAGGWAMTGFTQNVSDRTLRAWLNAGPVNKGIGGGLIFFAKEASARQGQATWILRYRIGNRRPEKVLGRYPDITLKEARELARRDRALVQQGIDVSAKKRLEKPKALEMEDVRVLGQVWYERHILKKIKNPAVVERVPRRRDGLAGRGDGVLGQQ